MGNELAVEPGGATSMNLRLDWQVGTHRERDALAAGRILEVAQLNDTARRSVAGRVQIGQAHMVSAPVHAVDHGVGCAVELVIEASGDQPPDGWRRCVPAIECEVDNTPIDSLLGESAVDALDDVAALAECPHHGLRILRQEPSRRTKRLGKAKTFEFVHTADHGCASVSIRSGAGTGTNVYNAIVLGSLPREHAIELGPPVGFDLSLEIATDLKVASRPELKGGEMRSAGTHAVADVVARNHEIAAIVGFAAHDDMDVRIVGIPMINSDPIEPGAEVPLCLRHQRPRGWPPARGQKRWSGRCVRIAGAGRRPSRRPPA